MARLLSGKVALVTGGGSGIGRASALTFAREGAKVIVADVVLAFAHSPVMLAFSALDLGFLSGGRFILGLGVAHQNRNNNWYAGHDAGKPVSQMREYLQMLQGRNRLRRTLV